MGEKTKLYDRERHKKRGSFAFFFMKRSLAASYPLRTRAFCYGSNYMQPRAEGVPSLSDLVDSHCSNMVLGIREQIVHILYSPPPPTNMHCKHKFIKTLPGRAVCEKHPNRLGSLVQSACNVQLRPRVTASVLTTFHAIMRNQKKSNIQGVKKKDNLQEDANANENGELERR